MNKMTVITIISILAIITVAAIVPRMRRGSLNTDSECKKKAEDTYQLTPRSDRDNAAEESYYYCLIEKGADPYKLAWNGKVTDRARIYIEKTRKFLDKNKN